jgi:hypothetical protein
MKRLAQLVDIHFQNIKTLYLKRGILKDLKDFQNLVSFNLSLASDVPGPGNYSPKNNLSPNGSYVLSTNKSNGKRMFLKSYRNSFVD